MFESSYAEMIRNLLETLTKEVNSGGQQAKIRPRRKAYRNFVFYPISCEDRFKGACYV
jgi:hypothetical protein